MALIVEDGTGMSDSESYQSVAGADAYHTKFGNTSWGGLSTSVKELALRKATQYLDNKYGGRWLGSRSYRDQALDFPRYGIIDRDGYVTDFDAMPADLLNATSELALISVTEDLEPDVAPEDSGAVEAERVQVGPIAIDESYAGALSTEKKYTRAERFLRSLITSTGANRG